MWRVLWCQFLIVGADVRVYAQWENVCIWELGRGLGKPGGFIWPHTQRHQCIASQYAHMAGSTAGGHYESACSVWSWIETPTRCCTRNTKFTGHGTWQMHWCINDLHRSTVQSDSDALRITHCIHGWGDFQRCASRNQKHGTDVYSLKII